jgi:hypothetical protein
VCFPWNEPDITVWNRSSAAEEAPWRVVPPEYCLKNRPLRPDAGGGRVQEQSRSPGALQPGKHTVVAHLDGEGGVLAADWKNGRGYLFAGIAADAWKALLSEGDAEGAVERLEQEWDVERETLRADVHSVLERALDLGCMTMEAGTDAGGHG